MVDEKIVKYIQDGLKAGKPLDALKSELLAQGWPAPDVEEAAKAAQAAAPAPAKGAAPTPVPGAPEGAKPPSGKKKKILLAVVVIVVIVLILGMMGILPIFPLG